LAAVARYRFRLGQYAAARELAAQVLAATDPATADQAALHGEALLLFGMCAAETYSLAECEDYYRRAADLAREIGDAVLLQRALHNLGSAVYLMRGQFALAIAADTQALEICRQGGLDDWAQFPLMSLAIAYQITGQATLAHKVLAELRGLARPGSGGEGYAAYVEAMLRLDTAIWKVRRPSCSGHAPWPRQWATPA
jgi:tetratricopeptide (TPR) repeat protein